VSESVQVTQLASMLIEHGVPGVAVAIAERDGRCMQTFCAGVTSTSRNAQAINPDTVFEAASLSKPCFALAVLRLVDSGHLALDEPLSSYFPSVGDERRGLRQITARHALSHSSGLPNLSSDDRPIRAWFPPGERFSYSGEGFVYLQKCVEHITRQPLDAVMRRLVFDPLSMTRSDYVWREDFAPNFAAPHDGELRLQPKSQPSNANAASSLHTTVTDFAAFLAAVLSGDLLKPPTVDLWLSPSVYVPLRAVESLDPEANPETNPHVAWGLGWGLEPGGGTFFQWGANDGFRAFTMGSVRAKTAVVALTNGDAGLRLAARTCAVMFSGERPAFTWLNLDRPRKRS
jgi:CubicO group peptidase (beta-lactamase class C family)